MLNEAIEPIPAHLLSLAVHVENLSKFFDNGEQTIALKSVSLTIEEGSFVAIVGASGSGKSTLLHLLAGLDQPTKEKNQVLEVCGESLLNRSENWLASFRARNAGFVLQFFGLLPTMTIFENVLLAGYFGKCKDRNHRAKKLLSSLGLADRLHHYPSQLSGGQRQKVAIARALINEPKIVFADEPTGNLDSKSGEEVFSQLKHFNKTLGITVLLVSHDNRVETFADRVIELMDGSIIRDQTR